VREAVLAIRETKFESPKKVGNAGSFFKNPIVNKFEGEKLINSYPNIPMRKQEDGNYKTSAGWFIEKAGWKGKTYKGAGVSPRHALILINPEGAAKADDLVDLSNMIIKDVKKKFGIKLEREVQLINF
jgi:UDP-N-acetylmuramate dehydrogenase